MAASAELEHSWLLWLPSWQPSSVPRIWRCSAALHLRPCPEAVLEAMSKITWGSGDNSVGSLSGNVVTRQRLCLNGECNGPACLTH